MNFMPKRRKAEKMGVRTRPQFRCSGHLQWVRGHQCIIEGRPGHECSGRIHACHVRRGTDGCMGVQPSDYWTFAACEAAHIHDQHQRGEAAFERKWGLDLKVVAREFARRSPHRRKWEDEGKGPDR